MPTPFHLSLTGTTQGPISQGCCTMKGREDTILCQALNHEVSIPRDPQTGLPTGKRLHSAFTITKVFDKSSPKLFQALCTGEQMKDVTFKFYRISAAGQEEHYYTVKLENAIIVSLRPWVANCLDPGKKELTDMEDVSFTYRKIIWTWVPDGVEAQDDWTVPK